MLKKLIKKRLFGARRNKIPEVQVHGNNRDDNVIVCLETTTKEKEQDVLSEINKTVQDEIIVIKKIDDYLHTLRNVPKTVISNVSSHDEEDDDSFTANSSYNPNSLIDKEELGTSRYKTLPSDDLYEEASTFTDDGYCGFDHVLRSQIADQMVKRIENNSIIAPCNDPFPKKQYSSTNSMIKNCNDTPEMKIFYEAMSKKATRKKKGENKVTKTNSDKNKEKDITTEPIDERDTIDVVSTRQEETKDNERAKPFTSSPSLIGFQEVPTSQNHKSTPAQLREETRLKRLNQHRQDLEQQALSQQPDMNSNTVANHEPIQRDRELNGVYELLRQEKIKSSLPSSHVSTTIYSNQLNKSRNFTLRKIFPPPSNINKSVENENTTNQKQSDGQTVQTKQTEVSADSRDRGLKFVSTLKIAGVKVLLPVEEAPPPSLSRVSTNEKNNNNMKVLISTPLGISPPLQYQQSPSSISEGSHRIQAAFYDDALSKLHSFLPQCCTSVVESSCCQPDYTEKYWVGQYGKQVIKPKLNKAPLNGKPQTNQKGPIMNEGRNHKISLNAELVKDKVILESQGLNIVEPMHQHYQKNEFSRQRSAILINQSTGLESDKTNDNKSINNISISLESRSTNDKVGPNSNFSGSLEEQTTCKTISIDTPQEETMIQEQRSNDRNVEKITYDGKVSVSSSVGSVNRDIVTKQSNGLKTQEQNISIEQINLKSSDSKCRSIEVCSTGKDESHDNSRADDVPGDDDASNSDNLTSNIMDQTEFTSSITNAQIEPDQREDISMASMTSRSVGFDTRPSVEETVSLRDETNNPLSNKNVVTEIRTTDYSKFELRNDSFSNGMQLNDDKLDATSIDLSFKSAPLLSTISDIKSHASRLSFRSKNSNSILLTSNSRCIPADNVSITSETRTTIGDNSQHLDRAQSRSKFRDHSNDTSRHSRSIESDNCSSRSRPAREVADKYFSTLKNIDSSSSVLSAQRSLNNITESTSIQPLDDSSHPHSESGKSVVQNDAHVLHTTKQTPTLSNPKDERSRRSFLMQSLKQKLNHRSDVIHDNPSQHKTTLQNKKSFEAEQTRASVNSRSSRSGAAPMSDCKGVSTYARNSCNNSRTKSIVVGGSSSLRDDVSGSQKYVKKFNSVNANISCGTPSVDDGSMRQESLKSNRNDKSITKRMDSIRQFDNKTKGSSVCFSGSQNSKKMLLKEELENVKTEKRKELGGFEWLEQELTRQLDMPKVDPHFSTTFHMNTDDYDGSTLTTRGFDSRSSRESREDNDVSTLTMNNSLVAEPWDEITGASRVIVKAFNRIETVTSDDTDYETTVDRVERALQTLQNYSSTLGIQERELLFLAVKHENRKTAIDDTGTKESFGADLANFLELNTQVGDLKIMYTDSSDDSRDS